jgi:hypothetical protein
LYEAGHRSLARRYFKVKDLVIENEFILPHTTVARVIFGHYVSTIITFALPISENKSRLFVKTYRNFWQNPIGDKISRDLMYQTMLQDKAVVENIHPLFEDGKFNMRFDKLQNTYKMFYTFLHFKCRFSTVLPNNCFRDSIIRHPTCFVNKGKVNSRNFTYDGPTFFRLLKKVVKDEMSSHL